MDAPTVGAYNRISPKGEMRFVSKLRSQRGEIRLRSLFELALIFAVAYGAIQVGPAVVLRLKFIDEMGAAANSPIGITSDTIHRNLMETAEGFGITLFADDLYVIRNQEMKKTLITATYEIHMNFWPAFTYVWLVRDDVEAFYF
jgi:hypothetical protein